MKSINPIFAGKQDITKNRQASFNYTLKEFFEAGIVLTGSEIKSIRLGHVNLRDSFGIVSNNEIWLLNTHISKYFQSSYNNHEETRTRKLLLHKREIQKIQNQIKLKGLTLVPTRMYFVNGRVKVELALCSGKKNYDKRQTEKERDKSREISKALKGEV